MHERSEARNPVPAAVPEGSGPAAEVGPREATARSRGEPTPAAPSNAVAIGARRRARRVYLLLAIAVAAGLAVWAGYAILTRNIETTDDARIEADVVTISPRVGGQLIQVAVADNQEVKKGELLVAVDPGPYQARLEQAEAELSIAQADVKVAAAEVTIASASSEGGLTVARAGVSNAVVSIRGADAHSAAAEAAVERADARVREVEADLERARQLASAGAIAGMDLEHREREAEVARAQLKEARAQATVAQEQARTARGRVSETKGRLRQSEPVAAHLERSKGQLELAQARVKNAQAAVDLARIDLESASVVAPADGRVTGLAARAGQMVQPSQLLLYLVPRERYVVANFKETQVGRMKPGQLVDVDVDAHPGRELEAKIESIAAGTGSRFSLLPADNATGNFVKVVQRVPVRIVWRATPPKLLLEPGMSVTVKVHTR